MRVDTGGLKRACAELQEEIQESILLVESLRERMEDSASWWVGMSGDQARCFGRGLLGGLGTELSSLKKQTQTLSEMAAVYEEAEHLAEAEVSRIDF